MIACPYSSFLIKEHWPLESTWAIFLKGDLPIYWTLFRKLYWSHEETKSLNQDMRSLEVPGPHWGPWSPMRSVVAWTYHRCQFPWPRLIFHWRKDLEAMIFDYRFCLPTQFPWGIRIRHLLGRTSSFCIAKISLETLKIPFVISLEIFPMGDCRWRRMEVL